jgi:hypothetical protein
MRSGDGTRPNPSAMHQNRVSVTPARAGLTMAVFQAERHRADWRCAEEVDTLLQCRWPVCRRRALPCAEQRLEG